MLVKKPTKKFKKSFRKLEKSGRFDRAEAEKVVELLAQGKPLPEKYQDHALQGEFSEMRECHIKPDLLLIYQIQDNVLVLLLVNIGSHSDLFK